MSKLKFLILFLLSSLLLFQTNIVSGATPYKGSLHQHTGYSTWWGYDGNPLTFGDDCNPRSLEGHPTGLTRNVAQLANQAGNVDIDWLGFSDHSYCINITEFNVVKTDCQNARNSTFTCLMGEELSTSDIVGDNEFYLDHCENPSTGEAHMGGYGLNSFINQSSEAVHCPSSPTAQGGINSINSQQGISILNHPNASLFGFDFLDFESLFTVNEYTGIEIFNKHFDDHDNFARNTWRSALLQDKKVFAYGGTDSHSDVSTSNYNVAYLDGSLNDTNVARALKEGYLTVSNNGEMYIEINYNGNTYHMGQTLNVTDNEAVNVTVSYDLDNGCALSLIKGQLTTGTEVSGLNLSVLGTGSIPISNLITDDAYFRAECIRSITDPINLTSIAYRIFTNPIWVNAVNATSNCSCGGWSAGSCSAGGCGANERLQTRSCTPSACSAESQCVPDVSCLGGSTLITVCASGCSYTTIQAAIDNSNPGDHINVTDSRNYAENLVIDSGDAEWLECSAGANISRNSGVGINVKNPSTVDDIYIRGCTIKNFGTGILLHHTTNARLENLSFINVGTSIYLDDDSDSNKIINNTISVSQDYGIFLAGTSWAGPSLNQIKYNKVFDSAVYGLWFKWGLQSQVIGNTINGSDDSGDFGFWFNGGGLNLDSDIYNNTIYSNDIGFDNRGDNNRIFGNIFCPTNPNGDIVISGSSSGLSGDYNTCDLPSTWNDAGTTGCRYSCNSPPIVNLVSPLNGSIIGKKDFNFTCYAEDATQLVNLSLYHNSTGIWHLNQSSVISGLSNSTTFMVRNLTQDVAFNWNCLTSDGSKSAFAAINWTVRVNLTNVAPTVPKELWCNGVFCNFNFTYSSNLNVSCAGSVDDDEDEITYSLDAFYSSVWSNIGNHTQSSLLTWNISAISGQSNVSLRCRSIDVLG